MLSCKEALLHSNSPTITLSGSQGNHSLRFYWSLSHRSAPTPQRFRQVCTWPDIRRLLRVFSSLPFFYPQPFGPESHRNLHRHVRRLEVRLLISEVHLSRSPRHSESNLLWWLCFPVLSLPVSYILFCSFVFLNFFEFSAFPLFIFTQLFNFQILYLAHCFSGIRASPRRLGSCP